MSSVPLEVQDYMILVYENFLAQGMSEEEAEKATEQHMEARGD